MLPLLLSVLLNGAIVPSPTTICPHPGPKGSCAHKPRCLPGTPSATPAVSVR